MFVSILERRRVTPRTLGQSRRFCEDSGSLVPAHGLQQSGVGSNRHLTGGGANLKRVLVSLFGATAGQGVVWYTGQFYALFYLQTILNVHDTSANYIVATALLLGMPLTPRASTS